MNKINVNMIYQWPLKKQIGIFAVIFSVVFLFGYYWDIANIKRKITISQNDEADIKQQLSAIFGNEANYLAELTMYPEYQSKLTAWKQKLIPRSETSELIKQILKLGSTNNIYFSLFDPANEEQDGAYSRIPINLVMVSTYNQLAIFISQMANLPHLIAIKKFVISSENKADEIGAVLADKAATENLLTVKMRIEIYLIPEKTANVK